MFYESILMQLSMVFRKGSPFQTQYIIPISAARWRHNFREICVTNCETFVRTTSYW